jgi:hypothetical protein
VYKFISRLKDLQVCYVADRKESSCSTASFRNVTFSSVCASGNRIASVWKETVAYCVAVHGISGHAGLLLWAPLEFQFIVTLM